MRTATFSPLCSQGQKVLSIECQQDTSMAGCVGELRFVGLTEIAGLNRGQAINRTIAKHAGKKWRKVFVKIERHQPREAGMVTEDYCCASAWALNSSLALISASTSSRLS